MWITKDRIENQSSVHWAPLKCKSCKEPGPEADTVWLIIEAGFEMSHSSKSVLHVWWCDAPFFLFIMLSYCTLRTENNQSLGCYSVEQWAVVSKVKFSFHFCFWVIAEKQPLYLSPQGWLGCHHGWNQNLKKKEKNVKNSTTPALSNV